VYSGTTTVHFVTPQKADARLNRSRGAHEAAAATPSPTKTHQKSITSFFRKGAADELPSPGGEKSSTSSKVSDRSIGLSARGNGKGIDGKTSTLTSPTKTNDVFAPTNTPPVHPDPHVANEASQHRRFQPPADPSSAPKDSTHTNSITPPTNPTPTKPSDSSSAGKAAHMLPVSRTGSIAKTNAGRAPEYPAIPYMLLTNTFAEVQKTKKKTLHERLLASTYLEMLDNTRDPKTGTGDVKTLLAAIALSNNGVGVDPSAVRSSSFSSSQHPFCSTVLLLIFVDHTSG
jgi:hypothetical protein